MNNSICYTRLWKSHLNFDVHAAFNNIEVKRAEERRIEQEGELAQEATQSRKGLVVDTEETLGSSRQPEAGGSSSQVDVKMVDAEEDPKGFVLVECKRSIVVEMERRRRRGSRRRR
ncbi:hypothetical protein HanOQP8_Chr02g0054531 [Helianthus annuus]|nr:hypothetical protein HanOQP8_Chr02g0054531 [Helianthus annuus]